MRRLGPNARTGRSPRPDPLGTTSEPKPRQGRYWGQEIINSQLANGTWLEGEEFCYPHGGLSRRCYALWEDGVKRIVHCGIPDTFFTVPASGRKQGKHIRGFVTSDEQGYHFHQSKGQDK